jgi:uracil-DNA glycosylase
MNIHDSWKELFDDYEFNLDTIYTGDKDIYPKDINDVFKVFTMDVKDIQIVLLGQDLYYSNEKQADGLSFSVSDDVKIPPSLKNIFLEIKKEFPERNYTFKNGNLTKWFQREKIFLLNCSLTVEKSKPGSHMSLWKNFTNDVIKYINENNKNCVYILLGKFSEGKKQLIKKLNIKILS